MLKKRVVTGIVMLTILGTIRSPLNAVATF